MSVDIVALTAVIRYVCIVKPHLYPVLFTRKKTIFSILFILLLAYSAGLITTLVTPILFEWHPFYSFREVAGLEVCADFSKGAAGFVTFAMVLIVFCYVSVYRAIRRHNSAIRLCKQPAKEQQVHTKSSHLELFWLQL